MAGGRLSVALFSALLCLALTQGAAEAKPKKKKKAAPSRAAAAVAPAAKPVDMMALAKELASAAGDEEHFGEHFGTLVSGTPQGRTYKANDPKIETVLVVFNPDSKVPRGVALVVNPKEPLTLRDVEKVFGHGSDMKSTDVPGFSALSFAKIPGKYPVEPVVYIPGAATKVHAASSVFRLLLRRTN